MNPGTPHAGDDHVRAPGPAHAGVADSPDAARVAPAPRSALDTPPGCPRCGYDQSGAVATWAEACPLRGTCPECGYEFAWREVFNPDQKRLPRFVEHCRRRAIPVAAVRTLLWALIPWWFWSRVKLHHEVRKRRWVVWLVLVLLGWHGVNVGLSAVANWNVERAIYRELVKAQATLGPQFGETPLVDPRGSLMLSPDFGWRHLRAPLLWPLVDRSGLAAPWGVVSGFGGGWTFDFSHHVVVLAIGILATTTMPLTLMVMPSTRRRYKVRWAHVGRATVFGASWLVVPLAVRTWNAAHFLALSFRVDATWLEALPGFIVPPDGGCFLIACLAGCMTWWWWRALGRGWGIPRALGHAAAIVSISILAWLVLAALIDYSVAARVIIDDRPWGGQFYPRLVNVARLW